MNWKILLCLAFANFMFVYPREVENLKKLIEFIKRRLLHKSRVLRELDSQDENLSSQVEPVEEPQDLPRDEPTPPGHTLIKPASDTLKSAAKYPRKTVSGTLVYGNLDNLGITYGKTSNRVLYSGFRRNNNVLENLLKSIEKPFHSEYGQKKYPVIVSIKIIKYFWKTRVTAVVTLSFTPLVHAAGDDHQYPSHESDKTPFAKIDDNFDAGNDAREMLDVDQESSDSDDSSLWIRRSGTKHKNRQNYYASDIESYKNQNKESEKEESSDESSDYEKNPGNPYTVHKNRYKQNWLWNFAMTGDHINVNPRGPKFNNLGPTGGDLFYGRKWWYYNQDDYMPFR